MTNLNPDCSRRVDILDYARFAAAIAVMLFHYTYIGIAAKNVTSIGFTPDLVVYTKYGYLGVEFFFMISGYVIFFSAKNSDAAKFTTSRFLRLYPAFLTGVLLTSLVVFLWGTSNSVYPSQIICNLTMVPRLFGRDYVDQSYWTLQLELQFYILISFFLLFRLKKIEKFFLIWPILILVASSIGGKEWPIVGGYFSYFAAGTLFAMKRDKSGMIINVLLLLCLAESIVFSGFTNTFVRDKVPLSSNIIVAIVIGLYLFFWLINKPGVQSLPLPRAKFLGAITYPLYLVHQTIGYVVMERIGSEETKLIATAGAILISIALAFLIHRYVERNLKRFWQRGFESAIGIPMSKLDAFISKFCKSRNIFSNVKPDQLLVPLDQVDSTVMPSASGTKPTDASLGSYSRF